MFSASSGFLEGTVIAHDVEVAGKAIKHAVVHTGTVLHAEVYQGVP